MNRIHVALTALLLVFGSVPTPAQSAPESTQWLDAPETVVIAGGDAYDARGRRDPFVSSIDIERQNRGARLPGVRGMQIAELDLQGIVVADGGRERLALVLGSDDKGYVLREGDLLFDGKVKEVAADHVVYLRKVDDPLSLKEFEERLVWLEASSH